MSRDAALVRLDEGDGPTRSRALLSLAHFDNDWRWFRTFACPLLDDRDDGARATAALCFAHLARIHRVLDLELIKLSVIRFVDDPIIRGRVKEVLGDLEVLLD